MQFLMEGNTVGASSILHGFVELTASSKWNADGTCLPSVKEAEQGFLVFISECADFDVREIEVAVVFLGGRGFLVQTGPNHLIS